jgi:hypothetical protein
MRLIAAIDFRSLSTQKASSQNENALSAGC